MVEPRVCRIPANPVRFPGDYCFCAQRIRHRKSSADARFSLGNVGLGQALRAAREWSAARTGIGETALVLPLWLIVEL